MISARAEYVKAQPTLHAMTVSSGYSSYYDAYEIPDFEIDEYVYSRNQSQTMKCHQSQTTQLRIPTPTKGTYAVNSWRTKKLNNYMHYLRLISTNSVAVEAGGLQLVNVEEETILPRFFAVDAIPTNL